MPRYYYAEFHVTVNPHITYTDAPTLELWREEIVSLIRGRYSSPSALLELFGVPLKSVTVYPIGVEVGGRHRSIHAHFNLLVKARAPLSLDGLNRRHQEFFCRELGVAGVYARVSLVRGDDVMAQRLNYNAKKDGQGAGYLRPAGVRIAAGSFRAADRSTPLPFRQ